MKRFILSLVLVVLAVPAAAQVASAVNVEGYSDEASARAVFSAKSGVGKLLIPLRIVNPNGGADRVTYLVIYQVPLWQYELGVGTFVQNAGLPAHNGASGGGYWWLGSMTSTLYSSESAALTAATNTPVASRNTLRLSQRATTQGNEWEFVLQPYTYGMSLP